MMSFLNSIFIGPCAAFWYAYWCCLVWALIKRKISVLLDAFFLEVHFSEIWQPHAVRARVHQSRAKRALVCWSPGYQILLPKKYRKKVSSQNPHLFAWIFFSPHQAGVPPLPAPSVRTFLQAAAGTIPLSSSHLEKFHSELLMSAPFIKKACLSVTYISYTSSLNSLLPHNANFLLLCQPISKRSKLLFCVPCRYNF